MAWCHDEGEARWAVMSMAWRSPMGGDDYGLVP